MRAVLLIQADLQPHLVRRRQPFRVTAGQEPQTEGLKLEPQESGYAETS